MMSLMLVTAANFRQPAALGAGRRWQWRWCLDSAPTTSDKTQVSILVVFRVTLLSMQS
ncbi:hypothetical protein HanPI659440_Chr14g0541731 [Helianthus annuus]|nr:hypothetical protein HanPI659440_Chr14g0541731 [Helianthus annuus]